MANGELGQIFNAVGEEEMKGGEDDDEEFEPGRFVEIKDKD